MQPVSHLSDKARLILDVAEALIAEKGYDATSVRAVAKAAGVNVAMISYYFGSKEKMMEALVACRISALRLSLEEISQQEEVNELDKLLMVADLYIRQFITNQRFHRIMAHEAWIHKQEQTSPMILAAKRENFALIKKIIDAGVRKGLFRKNIDPVMMFMTLNGTTNQVMTRQGFIRQAYNLSEDSPEAVLKFIQKKLRLHFKNLLKVLLQHES